jgi:iron complex transport system ATP-binding protein
MARAENGQRTKRPEVARAEGLVVENVTFRYPQFELAPTSLEAKSGELVALIGPNGSGKSTLLEIASGHLRPRQGSVRLSGEDLHHLSSRARARRVGVARQETPLLFSSQVREFIRHGRHPYLNGGLFENPRDEERVEWAIEKTHLDRLADRKMSEISGGEFQRAVLARTLAQQPRLLLLDEPTANLDIRYQIEMLRMIRSLARSEKFIALIVTHELNLAAELADRVLVMDRGRLVCQGTPDEVLQSDLLSRVFQTPVRVDRNPSSGRPLVSWGTP